MSERAKEEALAGLHAELAKTLTAAIEKGEPLVLKDGTAVVDEEGKPLRGPASAAILNVARQFLKDNDIKALPATGTPLDRLGKAVQDKGVQLPFEGEPPVAH